AARSAADEQERPLRVLEPPRGLAYGIGVGRLRVGDAVGLRRERRLRWELGAQPVAWDLDEHGAPAAAPRPPGPGPRELGNPLRLVDQDRLLGHRPEHADEVELLEGVLLIVVERDAADQDHDRRVGDVGGSHTGEEIRGAGPAGDEAYARMIGDAR